MGGRNRSLTPESNLSDRGKPLFTAVFGVWLVLFTGLATVLSGCGFEPVYAPGGGRLETALSAIHVEQPEGVVGQAIRNAILDEVGARQGNTPPRYRLRMQLREERERAAIQADETAARFNLTVIARWTLLTADGLQTIDKGQVQRTVGYNVVNDAYGTLIAERDANLLAARQVGQAIRTRLLLALR